MREPTTEVHLSAASVRAGAASRGVRSLFEGAASWLPSPSDVRQAFPGFPQSLSRFTDLVEIQRRPESSQDGGFDVVQNCLVRLDPSRQAQTLLHPGA